MVTILKLQSTFVAMNDRFSASLPDLVEVVRTPFAVTLVCWQYALSIITLHLRW